MVNKLRMQVGRPTDTDAVAALADVIDQSFAGFGRGPEAARQWLDRVGHENVRVVRVGARVVGGLGILNFGQYFGGRVVSSAGITCVGVSPDVRGAGVGTRLMQATVRDLARRGFALSVLYPSTWGLYRAVGYEPAGTRITYELSTEKLAGHAVSGALRPATEADHAAIHAVHERRAIATAGNVCRSDLTWQRILESGDEHKRYVYVIESEQKRGMLEGYVSYRQQTVDGPYEVVVSDHAALTPNAGRLLVSFLASHSTMVRSVILDAGPSEPLLWLCREENLRVRFNHFWMLRILDVRKALCARGYPSGVRAEIHFEIEDALLNENNGRIVLKVDGGRGQIRRGGRGKLKVTIRGLAPLYTGHLSACELRMTGLIDGPDDVLCETSAVFAGPSPWMNDRF